MTDRPPRIVFDRTAVLAYARSSVAVGELLVEVDEEGGCAVVPLPCLVEAALMLEDRTRLEVLTGHPAVNVLGDDPATWRDLAALRDVVNSSDMASAVLWAIDLNVDIFTRTPRLYAGVADGTLTLPFDD